MKIITLFMAGTDDNNQQNTEAIELTVNRYDLRTCWLASEAGIPELQRITARPLDMLKFWHEQCQVDDNHSAYFLPGSNISHPKTFDFNYVFASSVVAQVD